MTSQVKGGSPMSATVTVEEAQAKLAELIGTLNPGEEIVITRNNSPIAKLVGQRSSERKRRRTRKLQGDDQSRGRGRRTPERLRGVHAVRLLLDTHAFLWFTDRKDLGRK